MTKPSIKSYFLLFFLAAIWGSAFFNYKIVLTSFDYFLLAGGRLFFATIFLCLLSLFFLRSVNFKILFSKNFYIFFIIGFTNYVLPFSLIAFGIDGMSSGLAALLMSAGPFYAIILSHLFTNDKFNKYKLIGTLIGFVSVFILFYDQVYIEKSTTIKSVLIVMSASLSYVIGGLFIQKFKKFNNQTIATLSMGCGTVLLLPICIFQLSKLNINHVELNSLISLIYLGVFSTAIAFMMRAKLIFDNGLIFMSQVSLLIPIFGLYFSWLFLSEKFTANMLISLLIILFGLWVLQLGYKKSNS
ncbi:MAG: DMT family transporter [alpha proteobacterium HIMB114]|jgi:drug/metabolite transporter (DMT)-like permease|nr:MAG: DMT family transporter [alpha proteobacterium HIMB114]|tara:strand:- start:131 stop:1030 length:900 start_codon:yes stop_codon:yes gene_type:complete